MGLGLGLGYLQTGPFLDHLAVIIKKVKAKNEFNILISGQICTPAMFSSCERPFATGIVTSPSYPDNYPSNLRKTETIQVEQGLILLLQFTAFNIESPSPSGSNRCSGCRCNYLTIRDGDGTILMDKSCGNTDNGDITMGGQNIGFSLPPNITSRSNVVNFIFTTTIESSNTTRRGWSVTWSAVPPGFCLQHV